MFRLKKSDLFFLCVFSLLIFGAAHAFCYLNALGSGTGVLADVSRNTAAQFQSGCWLQPIWFRLRGGLSAPLQIGVLCFAFLLGSILLLCDGFGISERIPQAAVCCAILLSPGLLELNAASLSTADAFTIGFFLMVLGAWCMENLPRFSIPAGMLCCFLGSGLDSSLWCLPAAFALLRFFSGSKTKLLKFCALLASSAASLIAGIAFLHLRGTAGALWTAKLDCSLAGPAGWILTAAKPWFGAALTVWKPVSLIFRWGIPAALACGILKKDGFKRLLLLLLLTPLFLLSLNPPVCAAQENAQTGLAFSLLPFLLILLAKQLLPWKTLRAKRIAAALTAVLAAGSFIFGSQVYLKLSLDRDSTLSLMTRVIARAEQTDGYTPGITPVAILGTPEESPLAVQRKGFEHLSALRAASHPYSVSDPSYMTWYLWDTLGYPFNLVGGGDLNAIAASGAASEIPSFPASGSIRMLDGTLVIRLSD